MFPNFIPSPYFSPSLKQRVLIRPSEISNLYNSGTGIQHPFTLTVGTTSAPLVYSENQAASDTNLPVTIDYGTLPTQASTTAYLPAVVYPYATTTSTSTINTLTVATTTSYTVYSPFSNYQDDSRGTVTTYLTLNGTLIGTYTYQKGNEASTGKLTFIHTNYLGTPVFETDDKGDIVEMDITDVFGNYVMRDQRKDSPYHAKAYTGHEYDDVTGLTYAHARYLDTKAHTFLSVDPLLYSLPQSYLTDPQEMNSYAYARNNPIVYTDPTGLASYINYGQGYLPPTTVYITPYTRFTGNNSPTYLSIRNPRPQPTITKSNIDDLLLSGYGSMARDDWQAGNYGYAALFVGMAASSAVSSVYTAPEKAILREGVIATELLKGKKVTAPTLSHTD